MMKQRSKQRERAGEAFSASLEVLETVVEKEATAIASAIAQLKTNGKNCSGSVSANTPSPA
jgi:hypothetical protein